MAWAESSWRVDAVSPVGALGVLQLTPDTVDFVSKNLLHLDHDLDVHDPVANARMSGIYLKHLLGHTDGDLHQALMAYNQGLRSLYRDGPYPDAEAYADTIAALRPVFGGAAPWPTAALEAVNRHHGGGRAHGGLDSRSVHVGLDGAIRLTGGRPDTKFPAGPDDDVRRADARATAVIVAEIAASAGRPSR